MSTLGGQSVQVNLVNELANIDPGQVTVFLGNFACSNTVLVLNPGAPETDPSASWTVKATSPPGVGAGALRWLRTVCLTAPVHARHCRSPYYNRSAFRSIRYHPWLHVLVCPSGRVERDCAWGRSDRKWRCFWAANYRPECVHLGQRLWFSYTRQRDTSVCWRLHGWPSSPPFTS